MQVVLRHTKEQDNAIAWPTGWIEQARYGRKLFACVKMATGAEDITNRILSAELRVRRSSSSTIVSSNAGVRWKVLGVAYILPGRIIYSERLADDVSGGALVASGPCKLKQCRAIHSAQARTRRGPAQCRDRDRPGRVERYAPLACNRVADVRFVPPTPDTQRSPHSATFR